MLTFIFITQKLIEYYIYFLFYIGRVGYILSYTQCGFQVNLYTNLKLYFYFAENVNKNIS